ncbi:MAG: Ribosomal RNA small subunit methyltransferase E [Holosporales bacterium]
MKVRLFTYLELKAKGAVVCNKDQSHYLINVLRKKQNDEIFFFNGKDGEWKGHIFAIHKQGVEIIIDEQTKPHSALKQLILIFCPIKQDRLNLMIEKATELGVTHLKPIISDYTQVKKINEEKLFKIAIEAAEQSERLCVPTILKIESLKQFLKDCPFKKEDIGFCNEALAYKAINKKESLNSSLKGVIIGPEGGFSKDERDVLSSVFQTISLGHQILRTETAAIVALDRVRQIL